MLGASTIVRWIDYDVDKFSEILAHYSMTAATQELNQFIPVGEGGPYKFLDYFEEKDESTFAGRDRDIKEITARIMVDRTVVLYGRSGLGKTSLVLAGLFPELRRRDLLPVYCRVLQNPRTDVGVSVRSPGPCRTGAFPRNTSGKKSSSRSGSVRNFSSDSTRAPTRARGWWISQRAPGDSKSGLQSAHQPARGLPRASR